MEITGTLVEKFDAVHVSATFKKRTFVIECVEEGREKFSEMISLEFIQDKCDLIDSYNIGDRLEVLFNLKGRKWASPQGEVKYFNTLQAWKIHSEKSGSQANPAAPQAQAAPQQPAPVSTKTEQPVMPEMPKFDGESEDDIPF